MIDTQKYLGTFFKGTKNPSLEAMEYFMNHFEWCCDKLKIIHIAGTNGKGSVLETLTNILIKQGYKVGKFLSPHLIRYNERLSIKMDKKVKVVSLVSQRVVLTVPDIRLRRVWERKGATMVIPFEQLEEAMYSPGVENMFRNGILGIDDMEVKIALGLEPEDAKEPVNIITLNDDQRKRYLKVMPVAEFRQKVKELPIEQINELAAYAIANEIMDYDKSEIIQQYVDVDIMKAIKLNRDDQATVKEK